MARHFNITGEITQALLEVGLSEQIKSLSLTNIHATTKCYVDLYIERKMNGKFYLLKSVSLPVGVTLLHDIVGFSNLSLEIQ